MSPELEKYIRANCLGIKGMSAPPVNWDMSRYTFIKLDDVQYILDRKDFPTYPKSIQKMLGIEVGIEE